MTFHLILVFEIRLLSQREQFGNFLALDLHLLRPFANLLPPDAVTGLACRRTIRPVINLCNEVVVMVEEFCVFVNIFTLLRVVVELRFILTVELNQ